MPSIPGLRGQTVATESGCAPLTNINTHRARRPGLYIRRDVFYGYKRDTIAPPATFVCSWVTGRRDLKSQDLAVFCGLSFSAGTIAIITVTEPANNGDGMQNQLYGTRCPFRLAHTRPGGFRTLSNWERSTQQSILPMLPTQYSTKRYGGKEGEGYFYIFVRILSQGKPTTPYLTES